MSCAQKSCVSLYLIKHHVMQTYWEVGVWLHAFLTSVLDMDENLASRPGLFIPGKRLASTHWTGTRVWTCDGEGEISTHAWAQTRTVNPWPSHCTNWATPAPNYVLSTGKVSFLQNSEHTVVKPQLGPFPLTSPPFHRLFDVHWQLYSDAHFQQPFWC
jgi:hypothetical protein